MTRVEMIKKLEKENPEITIYGYEDVRKFMADHFINDGNDEFRCNNISMSVGNYFMDIHIYTDNINHICAASIVLNYKDFAIRYRPRDKDIKVLSRNGEEVSDKMYISIKKI